MNGKKKPRRPKMKLYMLVDGRVVATTDPIEWAVWKEESQADCQVGDTTIPIRGGNRRGEARVSTVFLGLDHDPFGRRREFFETLVMGGPLDGRVRRYATLGQARRGHDEMVGQVRQALFGGGRS